MRCATRAKWDTPPCRRPPTASSSPRARSSASQAAEAGLRYAYLQFDGIGNAANSASQGRQPVRREAARHRESVRQRRRHHPGHHHRQRHQQRAGGPHRPVRARQPQEDSVPFVPAGFLHGPRRSRHRRAPRRPALHAVAPGARREEPDRPGRAGARLVPDFLHLHLLRLERPGARAAGRLGPVELRLPPQLRRRHGRDGG